MGVVDPPRSGMDAVPPALGDVELAVARKLEGAHQRVEITVAAASKSSRALQMRVVTTGSHKEIPSARQRGAIGAAAGTQPCFDARSAGANSGG